MILYDLYNVISAILGHKIHAAWIETTPTDVNKRTNLEARSIL